MDRSLPFFRGSEFPRLIMLAVIMLAGWAAVWGMAGREPLGQAQVVEEKPTVTDIPRPVVADTSPEFESVTDRTPIGFRDNAAYRMLLERARAKSPSQLAEEARRDLVLAHLWERPELYRGVPVHLLGTVRRVLSYESKLSATGWLYEAWIFPADERTIPYVCVFEDAPKGFPIGANVSERVVFNGYFFKIMRYQAGDVSRGAPVLVGRLGWEPRPVTPLPAERTDRTLFWSLVVLGCLFLVSLLRWGLQLSRILSSRSPSGRDPAQTAPSEEIEPEGLQNWLDSLQEESEGVGESD